MDALGPLGGRLRRRGRVGAAFAAYLSSRVDLMTQAEALELATMPEPVGAAPYGAIQRLFTGEVGRSLEEAFASFEAEPFDSDLLFQWHRARLESGEPVVFKVVHPELDEFPDVNLEHPSELEADLRPFLGHRSQSKISRTVSDFEGLLLRSLDLRQEAGDLIELRQSCEDMSLVTIPRVHLELSGERFLTLSDLDGSTIAERRSAAGTASATASAGASGNGGARLARRVCRAWLRLVFSAAIVPTDPRGRNVLLLADGKVAFCGGPFQSLSGRTRDQLRSYLTATAIQDHESLAEALLQLTHPHSPRGERRLRHALRHTAPFRDGGWDTDSDSLSSSLLAHWHQAAAFDLRPRGALMGFLRGLTLLTREAYILAPGESSFREAFQELRLYQLFAESVRLSTGNEVAPITDLPRKLDRGLTLAAGDGSRPKREKAREGSIGSWSGVLALLMALAAVVLFVHHAAPATGAPNWVERSGAVVVLVLGGLLLRFAAD